MIAISDHKRGILGILLRRLLHTYFRITRGLTVGVRAVVRTEEGKFLLVRHTYTPGWFFPGGGVERGESCEDALSRELLQETGFKLSGTPTFRGVYFNNGVSRRDHVLLYVCRVEDHSSGNPSSLEIAEMGFFDINALPHDTDPGTVLRIKEIVEGAEPRKVW